MTNTKIIHLTFYLYAALFLFACKSQQTGSSPQNTTRGDIRVMFYNVENLFDTIDAPEKKDEEFTPDDDKNWDSYRYYEKLNHIFQVIAAIGEQQPPEIIGFVEVENKEVVRDVLTKTPLERYSYEISHFESPDFRGIDVALCFRSDLFTLISEKKYPVVFPAENYSSRDILHTQLLYKKDTLHLFVNHWPSRRGGQERSEPKRMHAASILKNITDSLLTVNPQTNILIMGDFNDEPYNKSIAETLNAKSYDGEATGNKLYNLSSNLQDTCKCGTYRYRGQWNMLDQFIVSSQMLLKEGFVTDVDNVHIFKNQFLLQEDEKYGGYFPHRTYLGPRYLGGYSDHLPIYLDVFYNK